MSSRITRQRSREGSGEAKDLETQPNRTVDSVMHDKPSFCLNEEQRKMKSFHERKTDVDSAIEWIAKEIKFLKQQDQNLMRQFVKLRGVLNSIKNRPPPTLNRKSSLPENSPNSPISPLYRISEDSPGTFFRDETSPGLRRRAQSDFAGSVPENYPVSPLSLVGDDYEHFAI
ncbi:uncharacterized protein LOC110066058 [Orbicella faveolata]|uniref:uncharacterized protein LOC110066058 n=1 Tax=Orbicella faveolata TaxID=48498 RepID=UPI0009E1A9FD|nr:uncharacterized protein LOC110066058 [Orbicella faveolata]